MAKNNKVEDVSSLDSFKKITLVPNRLCAIHFHAPWATQCTSMDEAMLILAGEDNYKEVTFARVEAEEQPEISMDYDVAAVPTLLFMEGELSISYPMFAVFHRPDLGYVREKFLHPQFQGAKCWTELRAQKWPT